MRVYMQPGFCRCDELRYEIELFYLKFYFK